MRSGNWSHCKSSKKGNSRSQSFIYIGASAYRRTFCTALYWLKHSENHDWITMTDPDHYKPYIRCMHAKQLNLALKWHAFVHETTWSLQEEEKNWRSTKSTPLLYNRKVTLRCWHWRLLVGRNNCIHSAIPASPLLIELKWLKASIIKIQRHYSKLNSFI